MNASRLARSLLAAAALGPAVCAAQSSGSESRDPLISATGAAQVLVPPSGASIVVLLSSGRDRPPGTTVDSLLGRIQSALKQGDSRISMFGFSGSARRRGRDETRAYFSQYDIDRGILIDSLHIDSVAANIRRLRDADVSSAVAVLFPIDETDPAISEAIRQATETARQHADAMAGAAGGLLGRLVRLSTHRINADNLRRYDAGVVPESYTPPRHVGVRVTVHGTWVLQPL